MSVFSSAINVVFTASSARLTAEVRRARHEIQNMASSSMSSINGMSGSLMSAGTAMTSLGSIAATVGMAITAAFVMAAAKSIEAIESISEAAVKEYSKTQTSMGEVKSLGVENLEAIRKEAIKFSNTWAGTSRDDFISASYDIKSGISSLTDEAVAKFTSIAALTGKATKSTVGEMTNLFAKGHGIYRNQFSSDEEFAEMFSAGISKSVQVYRTQGSEMSSYLSNLGASAQNAGLSLSETLALGGQLQTSMSGSEAATKLRAFINGLGKAQEKLKLSFVDETTNQLKSIPDIIDEIRKKYGDTIDVDEQLEIKEAFGTDEAMALIQLLYDKTGNLRQEIDGIAESMSQGTKATEEMAEAMNQGMAEKFQILKQRVSNIFDEIGKKLEPAVTEVLNKLLESLEKAQENGSIDRLAESLGEIANKIADIIVQLVDKLPEVIELVSRRVKTLAENFEEVIASIKRFIDISIKIYSVLNPTFGVFIDRVKKSGKVFNEVISDMRKDISYLTEDAKALSESFNNITTTGVKWFDTSLNTLGAMVKAKGEKEAKKKQEEAENKPKQIYEKSAATPDSEKKKDSKTAYEKAKEKIDNLYGSREELANSKIELAEETEDKKVLKTSQNLLVNILQDKLKAYLSLSYLPKDEQEKNNLDAARNRILTEIARLQDSMKESIDKIVGEFNKPSDISALTKYAFSTSNNDFNSNQMMNVYINGTNLSQKELEKSIINVANSLNKDVFINKDYIINKGIRDIAKN